MLTHEELLEITKEAAARIEDPDNWLQGEYAVDQWGCTVHPHDSDARRWCALGSIITSAINTDPCLDMGGAEMLWLEWACAAELDRISCINDMQGHKATLQALNNLIAEKENNPT